jgi:hypothetical protein
MADSKIKVLRFRSWLECEGDNNKPTKFPITSFVISAGCNAVPDATVTIATGERLGGGGEFSPIHNKDAAKLLLNVSLMSKARILFRNLDESDKTHVIFEGFVWQAARSYSFANTEVSVTLIHWLAALDAHSALNASVHPASVPSFTQQMFMLSLNPGTGTNTKASGIVGIAKSLEKVLAANPPKDFIADYIITMLSWLRTEAENNAVWSAQFVKSLLSSGLPLSAKDALLRLKGGGGTFPILKFTQEVLDASVLDRIQKVLIEGDLARYRTNTLWSSLVFFASQFSFMLVPRVHELRFIPKWFAPKIIEEVKNLKEVVVVGATWEHARPISGAVIIPGEINLSGTGVNQSKGEQVTVNSTYADAYYGHYFPGKGKDSKSTVKGTLLLREAPNWALPTYTVNLSLEKHDTTQGNKTEVSPAPPISYNASFSELIAQEAYWDESLKGRIMEIMCPLRFDVCPGSIVQVSTGIGRHVHVQDDALNVTYFGFVKSMRLTFDTINASATAQYTVTHAHSQDENDNLSEKHPYYDCKPFSCASWTENAVKTIED